MERNDDNQELHKVAILLCTYQGQKYIAEQLDSFKNQTYSNWEVWASDDGSQDDTCAILESYKTIWGDQKLSIHFGPAKGFVANFLSLTCKETIQADYYAYSDQDDVWNADKLERAVDWLKTIPVNVPAIYCSRTQLVDANNKKIGLSPLFTKPPSFANALMQNIGGGNTMVFNDAARKLLCDVGENIGVVTHDWWAYLVVSGCGGEIFYDVKPSLYYRQHEGSIIGSNSSLPARLHRIRMLFQGEFKVWNNNNIEALSKLEAKLTPENKEVFDRFVRARQQWLLPRLIGLKKSGIYRQTLLGSLGLVAAAIFNKI